MARNALVIGIIAVVILAIGAALVLSGPRAGGSNASGVPILLTDPPVVPSGTSALTVAYSSVQVHTSGTAGSGWTDVSGSGSINLLALVNASEVIGTAKLPANSTVNMVRFTVTSANITVNGKTSNVTLPNSTVTAHLSGHESLNSTGGVLLDFTPTVVTIYTAGNSTDYILVPSVKAIVVGNSSIHAFGERSALSMHDRSELEATRSNVSIVSSSISAVGNATSVSVTLRDNSNSSVTISHVLVFGNYTVGVLRASAGMRIGIDGNFVSSEDANASVDAVANAISSDASAGAVIGDIGRYHDASMISANIMAKANSSTGAEGNGTATVGMNESAHGDTNANTTHQGMPLQGAGSNEDFMLGVRHVTALNLLVSQNGTLYVPADISTEDNVGYTISPGATATLTFNGNIIYGNGIVSLSATPGSSYSIIVVGSPDVHQSVAVTAT